MSREYIPAGWSSSEQNYDGTITLYSRADMEAAQKRIATLEAHNKLLREVAVAAEWGAYYEGDAECPICRAVYDSRKKVQEHLPDCKYRDAIDGGAMGEEPMM